LNHPWSILEYTVVFQYTPFVDIYAASLLSSTRFCIAMTNTLVDELCRCSRQERCCRENKQNHCIQICPHSGFLEVTSPLPLLLKRLPPASELRGYQRSYLAPRFHQALTYIRRKVNSPFPYSLVLTAKASLHFSASPVLPRRFKYHGDPTVAYVRDV
jgi:hypothetical protein